MLKENFTRESKGSSSISFGLINYEPSENHLTDSNGNEIVARRLRVDQGGTLYFKDLLDDTIKKVELPDYGELSDLCITHILPNDGNGNDSTASGVSYWV